MTRSVVVAILAAILLLAGCKKQPQSAPRQVLPTPAEQNHRHIRVRVLNGCGIDGLAGRIQKKLALDAQIDVIAIGNTRLPVFSNTLIAMRRVNLKNLQRLQLITGVRRRIFAQKNAVDADFDIIIGADWRKVFGDI